MRARSFGKLSDGRASGLYILNNGNGMEASFTDFGAAMVSLVVPDRYGNGRDVVLGFSDAAGYETGHGSIGATVGRFANRIGGASFTLGGRSYTLTANNGPNCLHGGRDHYPKRLWSVKMPFSSVNSGDIMASYASESISDGRPASAIHRMSEKKVTFCLDSPDGDQGFPGNLHIEVSYSLTDDNGLQIEYSAVSDADTPLNLTNHSYFNLNGHDSASVLGHLCRINAASFTPVDENTLPTGEIRQTAGTPMDFRSEKRLGVDIFSADPQISMCGGYDHNFVIDGEGFREAAELFSEESGIRMYVLTDMPGVQLYTANGLGRENGKDGCTYGPHNSVCFETQFWPDAVNKENFPGGILRAGEKFVSRTVYRFTS